MISLATSRQHLFVLLVCLSSESGCGADEAQDALPSDGGAHPSEAKREEPSATGGGRADESGGTGGSDDGSGGFGSGAAGGSDDGGGGIGGGDSDGAAWLEDIEGLRYQELAPAADGSRRFALWLTQPADHDAAESSPWFEQAMTLVHRSELAPVVLVSTGYGLDMHYGTTELTNKLDANELVLEHRYFGTSIPEPADWNWLTIEQAAADTHRVVEALRDVYSGAWISTGRSKGGMTSVYHRRFFPGDVDGTVAYVAPLSRGAPDERYVPWLESLGGDTLASCRDDVRALQRMALKRREELIPLFVDGGYRDSPDEAEVLLEDVAIDLPFNLFMRGVSYCSWIPREGATTQTVFDYLTYFVWDYSSDTPYLLPYYYQAYTELGYPKIDTTHLDDLLTTDRSGPSSYFPGVDIQYSSAAMDDIASWVSSRGSELLFIYGEWDPWTAGAFELGQAQDSFVFVASHASHGATLAQLTPADRAVAYDAVGRWAGVSVLLDNQQSAAAGSAAPARRDWLLTVPPSAP